MTSSSEEFCCICAYKYGGTVVPTLLTCCQRHVCYNCAENDRNSKITNLVGNRKQIQCMFCKTPYHSSKDTPWIVNNHFISFAGIDVDSTLARKAQEKINGVATNDSRRSSRRSDATAVNNAQDEGDSNEEVEVIDLSHGQEDSAATAIPIRNTGTTLRRSRRRRLNLQSPSAEAGGEEGQSSSNNEIVANSLRSTRRRTGEVQVNGVDRSYFGVDNIITANIDNEMIHQQRAEATSAPDVAGDQCWKEVISKDEQDVYRIRCYNTAFTTTEDKFCRRTAEWCVNNGIIVTELEIAKILPPEQRFDGEAIRMKVASAYSNKEMREMCEECKEINPGEKPYIGSYKQFIEMKKGSIVILHTKGGDSQGDPPQTLTFGVIEDDSIATMTKEEAVHAQCPIRLSDSHMPGPYTRIGLVVKKVKWLRQGELRSVRGHASGQIITRQVKWLLEASPFWFVEAGTNVLKETIGNLRSDTFLRKTHSIHNQWTMG